MATLLSFVAILVLYSGVAYFRQTASELNLGRTVENPLHPRYLYVIFAFFALGSLFFPNINLEDKKLPRIFAWSSALFAVFLLVEFFLTPDSVVPLLAGQVEFMLMTLVFMIVFGSAAKPRRVFDVLRVLIVVECLLYVLLFLRPRLFPFLVAFSRPSGLWENPNIAALFIAGAMPLITLGVKPWVRAGLYAVTFAGVVATLSRGGVLVWVVLFLMSVVLRPERTNAINLAERALYAVGMGLTALLGSALISLDILGWLARLSPAPVARLSSKNDFSITERLYVVQLAWSRFKEHPLFGNGVGYTWDWGYAESTHNMFMLILVEDGVAGFCILLFWVFSLLSFPGVFGLLALSYFVTAGATTHNFFQAEYGLQIALYWLAGHVFRPAGQAQPSTASA